MLKLQKLTRSIWRWMPRQMRHWLVRGTQQKFTVSATAIVINSKSQVLLLDHVFRPLSGWALPGGFVGEDEFPEQAVVREIREEVGIGLENIQLLHARTIGAHLEIFFKASPVGVPVVKSREIIAFDWFSADDLPQNMSLTQKRLIAEVLNAHV